MGAAVEHYFDFAVGFGFGDSDTKCRGLDFIREPSGFNLGFGEGCGQRYADVAGADDRDVVLRMPGHGAQGYRACAMRSDAWPSP